MRLAALVTATAVLASTAASTGCASRSARAPLMVAGTVVAAAGLGVSVAVAREDDTDTFIGSQQDWACLALCPVAGALILAGLGVFTAGALSGHGEPAIDATPPLVAVHAGPPSSTAVDLLPAITTDDDTLRYAKAAGTAARQGKCPAARVLLGKVEQRDRRYHAALLATPSIALCQ